MDVAAIWRAAGDAARVTAERRIAGPPLVGVELKAYGLAKTVEKNLVRAFFACVVDFVPSWPLSVVTFRDQGGLRRTYTASAQPQDQFWFVTTGSLSGPAKAFGAAYDLQVVDHLETLKFAVAVTLMAARLRDFAYGVSP